MDYTVRVLFGGREVPLELTDGITLDELGQQLVNKAQVQRETIKLLLPGRSGKPLKLTDRPDTTATAAGLKPGMRVMMLASTQQQVQAVQQSKDLAGMAGFDQELVRAARRRRQGSSAPLRLPTGQYVFHKFQAWAAPGLAPPPSEALKLLHRLAADPGIVGIMNKHRWAVGMLSEMPPEGKVGVSAVCVLGVNINAGQEISLRLRTDDLKGFRRYDRIRETLCHELAHMVWGEHDNRFKALNSQLLKDAQIQQDREPGEIASNVGDIAGIGHRNADTELAEAAARRAQAAVGELLRVAGSQDGTVALQTLATILRNALNQPQEQRFRRLRCNNTAFQNRAGRFPAALQLLHLAGFMNTDQQQQQQQQQQAM
ncbi:hypothetical protein WJX73_001696 [Symbiochloris irregularis]|uniref:WLM domain-containing protein n=1 Tax=Symbiochloris irregularis TaxID=706552 RepID=A0AAW1NUQ6_9CHLO